MEAAAARGAAEEEKEEGRRRRAEEEQAASEGGGGGCQPHPPSAGDRLRRATGGAWGRGRDPARAPGAGRQAVRTRGLPGRLPTGKGAEGREGEEGQQGGREGGRQGGREGGGGSGGSSLRARPRRTGAPPPVCARAPGRGRSGEGAASLAGCRVADEPWGWEAAAGAAPVYAAAGSRPPASRRKPGRV